MCILYHFPFLLSAPPLLPPLQTQILCAASSVDPLRLPKALLRDGFQEKKIQLEFEIKWTPIHGRFEKNELIQKFNSEIAMNLTTRIDYIEGAPMKQLGRPRHGCGSVSGSASSPSTNRIESLNL